MMTKKQQGEAFKKASPCCFFATCYFVVIVKQFRDNKFASK